MKIKLTAVIIFLLGFAACSDCERSKDIKLNDYYAWVNQMPGTNPAFFMKGIFEIENQDPDEIENIELDRIEVTQDSKRLYSFTPETKYREGKLIILPGKGNPFSRSHELGETIKITFYLKVNDCKFNWIFDNAEVEEAN